MSNIELRCVDCDSVFYFTERDQKFYKEKNFQQPKRCFKCRQIKKQKREAEVNSARVGKIFDNIKE